jgi:FtsZ-binding cell division protein ZapB
MEVDANILFAGIGAAAVLGGAIMAYGELKTKVVGLVQRANSAQQAREKIFDRVGAMEEETKVQRMQIDDLRGNNDKLFSLHEKQTELNQKLFSSIEALVKDVHYIRDEIKKANG